MNIALVAMGMGTPGTLTAQALAALERAQAVVGAKRLLEALPEGIGARRVILTAAGEIAAWLEEHPALERVCVALSGDVGFYSGATALRPLLERPGWAVESLPGIATPVYLCARLGIPWQDVHLVSAHGRDCDPVAPVLAHPRCFFLVGGDSSPQSLCQALCRAGLGDTRVSVGARLGYPDEAIATGTAQELAQREFAAPAAVLTHRQRPAFLWPGRTFGLPDDAFVRGGVPMTKSEVRAVILSKLALRETDVVWDLGAGTGSVSVECALAARQGRVWAVEQNPEGCALIAQNKEAFGLFNLEIAQGMAPEICGGLPAPDAVFIGGSKGRLEEILRLLRGLERPLRVVLSAVTLETAARGLAALEELGFAETQAVQVAIARAEKAGAGHLLRAQNPVFVISGVRP